MMRTHKARGERSDRESDRLLWQRSRTTDAPEDETGRFLDLAAFADGLLDEEERDRVAAGGIIDPQDSSNPAVTDFNKLHNRSEHIEIVILALGIATLYSDRYL